MTDPSPIPPFLFGAKNAAEKSWLARLKSAGRIRKIAPRLYTSLPPKKVALEAKKLWMTIVAGLFPDALLSYRTALEYRPSADGTIFVTGGTNRRVVYPGVTIEFVRGPGPLADDPPFLGMRASSRARAFLENLSRDARRGSERTISQEQLEHRLEQILRDGGREEVVVLRSRAREIADELGWHAEYERLDGIIRAIFGTRPAELVASANARARAVGAPFDPACIERVQLLFGELRTRAPRSPAELARSAAHVRHKAFFDAYFSNYIEGTRFEIEEAEAIVFDKKVPARRPKDAHDVLGTFALLSDPAEMRRTPATADELVELVRSRHRTLMGARPEVGPGIFKTARNRAGDTHFVLPEYVIGTLRKGYELYAELDRGIARAIFVTYLVSEVHPFDDGNGRIARVMMNAELTAAGSATIIVPTSLRDDYLLALRALSRRHRPAALVDVLVKAAAFSSRDFTTYPKILAELQALGWFRERD